MPQSKIKYVRRDLYSRNSLHDITKYQKVQYVPSIFIYFLFMCKDIFQCRTQERLLFHCPQEGAQQSVKKITGPPI